MKSLYTQRISLLLNRRSAASLEQLLLDITEAFQIPRWHNDHIRKLFTLRGKEIKNLVEIFRAPGEEIKHNHYQIFLYFK